MKTDKDQLKLFEYSPISLWLEDFSGVKHKLDEWHAQGIKDLSTYLKLNPDEVDECEKKIRVLDVNR
ncbi:MAG: histidine kinase, partial [Anaerolineaceae bacterium]|nr:histidine kinase [Anaerolineaceae bacterium]